MLENNVRACPDELWTASLWTTESGYDGFSRVWYVIYHTLFFLDLYLHGSKDGFMPPAPFTLGELDPAGVLPERVYTKTELLDYMAFCRTKCRATIEGITEERAQELCTFGSRVMPFAELLIYTMRHVQEHGAQLAMLIGQQKNYAPGWVSKAKQ